MTSSGAVPAPDPTAQLMGQSSAMQALRTQIHHLATFDTLGNAAAPTVLLQGETGTGKGLVAQVLHASGPRARGPFVAVNCAAIPDTLLEAELFGFEAGAFSEAKRAKPGLFEAASGGSLFLDEIDALPGLLQGKLLTVLEAKRVRRLGAVVEQAVDVKLVAATQAVLSEAVAAGRFRADLYHRLAVVVLELPPLRARQEDILDLAQAFLQRYAVAHGLRPKQLSPEVASWLRAYDWPGNIRELSHLMERVTLLSAAPTLDATTLEQLVLPRVGPAAAHAPALPPNAGEPLDEAGRMQQALQATGNNVVQAARRLGLSRSGLRYRMQRYGLKQSGGRHVPAPPATPTAAIPPRCTEGLSRSPRVEAPGPAPSWEQKLVVVLAIDLTFPQSTGLEAIDYEPWTVAHHWEQALVEKVQGFGGVLVQRVGSLLLMAFGLPQALEQMPQRAVQAALAIRQMVAETAGRVGQEPAPAVRQAIHLGPLLVEGHTSASPGRFLAVGETLSLPMRLLGHATPGDLLVSPQVGRLVAGWCALQAREMIGAAGQPVQGGAYCVLGLVSRRSPLAGLGVHPRSQFIGRERELATLHDLLGQVKEGRGQVVALVGEPGVGKSRLLDEFRRSLLGQQVTYLEGRCLSYGSVIPYGPVLHLLRGNCGITETDGPEAMMEKVRGSLQEVGLDPDEGAPYLLHLLGVSVGTDALAALRPETLKARTFEILRQLSLRGSQQRPLILAVEDVQWVDKTSEGFFTTMVEGLAGLPILLLVTCRPGSQLPWLGKSYATQMVLPPLAPQDSRRLVQAILQTEHVPESLAQLLLAKAEGNPFFLEELVQVLVEQGIVVCAPAGGVRLTESWLQRPLTAIQLPPTVHGVLAARIDRLPAEAKELLQTLAVIGRAFSAILVTQVVEYPEAELHQLLAQLQGAELLYERPTWPEPEYAFKHALTQEVAYTALASARRRALHERTAQAIETFFSNRLEEHYSELAYHYRYSRNTEKAVEYLQRAGYQAVQRAAYVEAISHFNTALELLTTLPDTPDRTQQELRLQTMLGPALMNSKGFAAPDVEHVYARARELCRQVGNTPQLFPVLRGLWVFYFVGGKHETARELAEELLTLAQDQHDTDLLLEASRAVGSTLFYLGEFAAARAHLEQGIALYDPQQHRSHAFLYGEDPGVGCRAFAARVLWSLGYPDQALQRSREALTWARELAQPFSVVQAQSFATWMHQFRREGPLTKQHAEATITRATELGFPAWVGQGLILGGWALAVQGQAAEGIAQIRRGLSARQATGADLARPYWLALLAEVYGKVGQAEAGLSVLAEAFTEVRRTGERWWEAELYRLKGELLLQQALGKEASQAGPATLSPVPEAERPLATEAETAFHQALEIARRQQAKSLELRAAISLSWLWQRQGKREAARQLLVEIYNWFTEGFDTVDLQDAKMLLEALA